MKKKILLFSTLNPYPFWAGSENLWFDFLRDPRVNSSVQFQVMLANSPVTQKKASLLKSAGIHVSFYKHFNIDFARRNIYKAADKIRKRDFRTLPWYNEIVRNKYDLVWINVAALADLADLAYAVQLCKKTNTPYWLLLQHGYEEFFVASEMELESVTEVALSARRFLFVADRNRLSLERAIGHKLHNASRTVNAIPSAFIENGARHMKNQQQTDSSAKFFNLGRFSPRDKAQHLLLEIFAAPHWKNRDWQLSLIGVSGFGKIYLEKLLKYYSLDTHRIKFTPHTDNILQEIIKNDALLMPSMSEGTPFAMVESMACGRPALGTPVGGIPELIHDGVTGWLTKTTHITDIQEKMEQMWNDRQYWNSMGSKAQHFVATQYNQDSSFASLLNMLAQDLSE